MSISIPHAERAAEPEAPADGRRQSSGDIGGAQVFAEKLLRIAEDVMQKPHGQIYRSRLESKAHGERTAKSVVKAAWKAAGLTTADLESLRGSDPRKLKIAPEVWTQTSDSQHWIAQRRWTAPQT